MIGAMIAIVVFGLGIRVSNVVIVEWYEERRVLCGSQTFIMCFDCDSGALTEGVSQKRVTQWPGGSLPHYTPQRRHDVRNRLCRRQK